jgi:hypothetical protein
MDYSLAQGGANFSIKNSIYGCIKDNLMEEIIQNEKLLILCFLGPVSLCILEDYISDIWQNVTIERIRVPIPNSVQTFSDLVELHPKLRKHRLTDFDIIAMIVCDAYNHQFVEHFLIPQGVLAELKTLIKAAEQEKGLPIRLVGGNLTLLGDKLEQQRKLFDGLFIGHDSWESGSLHRNILRIFTEQHH